jgi:hypothetical protein
MRILVACIVLGAVCEARPPRCELRGATCGLQEAVVIDRIVSRTYGEILTLSDVWQALSLRLVDVDPMTTDTVQLALENRRLILREVNRQTVRDPTEAEIASQRATWETRIGAPDRAAALSRAGMDEAALQTWLRNDVRIAGYIERRFASTPGIDRAAAIAAWVSLLRDRAGLR